MDPAVEAGRGVVGQVRRIVAQRHGNARQAGSVICVTHLSEVHFAITKSRYITPLGWTVCVVVQYLLSWMAEGEPKTKKERRARQET